MVATGGHELKLLEREDELKTLAGALDSARAGEGRLVTIAGEPGIGKSSLLAAVRASAARRGMAVFGARGTALEQDLPFGVALQLLARPVAALPEAAQRDVMRGAAGLAGPLLDAGPRSQEPSLLHGLHWLTANLAELRPLALLVDDAHWADPPSLTWLNYLAHRIEDLPIAVVVAYRLREPGIDPSLLEALETQPAAGRLAPSPLSSDAVERLVRSRHPSASRPFCDACAEATNGNPFFLRELLETADQRGIEADAAEVGALADLAPDAVTRSVLERLRHAGDEAQNLARAVAVLGDGVPLRQASELAGLDREHAARTADELVRVGILSLDDGLGFHHPLLRSAVYSDIPTASLGALHAGAARLLAEEGAGPDRVATHLLQSPADGSPWVVETLCDAAARAQDSGAQQTAVACLRRALEEPPVAVRRDAVLVALAQAEAAAGEKEAAGRFADALERSDEPAERVELTMSLARTLSAHGRAEEAAQVLDDMLSELDGDRGDLDLALQATWIAIARTNVGMRERARERVRAMLGRASDSPSHEERMMLAQLAGERVFAGEPREEAIGLARLAYGDGRLLELDTSDGASWVVALGALGWAEDLDTYEAGFEAGLEDARRRGSVLAFATSSYGLTFSRYYSGRLAEAIADAQQALEAERYGWREYVAACRAQLAWALIERDELDQASEAIAPLDADPAWREHPAYAFVAEARGRIALARGDTAGALKSLLEAGRRIEAARIHNPAVLPWRSAAAIAASGSDPDRARELAAGELAAARRFGAPRAIGMALRAEGIVRGGAEGIELLRAAVAELEGSAAALERARALVDLGAALRASGAERDAREPLREALDQAHGMGARALERRAHEELVAAGARPRRPAITGIGALTPSERRVAGMAAEGMTNREIAEDLFVTVKAVQWHLTNTYRKLGVAGRPDLPPPRDFG